MSLVKPIPKKMREELSEDLFMKNCCLSGDDLENECEGRIEWHHNLHYAGKRVNEKWCILPVCQYHHRIESMYKNELNKIMVMRASYEELEPYCKAINYCALKQNYDTD